MEEFEIFMREHKGKQNAVTSKEIEAVFGCKGAEVRSMVNELRCRSVPICSCNRGYYFAQTQGDVDRTVAHLNGRIQKIREARDGLMEFHNTKKRG